MNVKELQDALRVLESAYAAGGAGKQAQEIANLVAALDGRIHQSIEDFARDTMAQMSSATTHRPVPNAPNLELVERYVAELLAARTDRSAFDRAFGALKSDKAVRLAESVEVANRYTNQPTDGKSRFKFDSKTAAFDFIFSTYISRAASESRLETIGRMTKWSN